MATTPAPLSHTAPTPLSRLWKRELDHYPALAGRLTSLSIVVLTTVLFYYQYYVISSVSDGVLRDTGMSFLYFVGINVVSVVASAVTSLAAGITDRFGRANLVTVGLLGCALVCLFGLSTAHTSFMVAFWYTVLGALEGVVLVATPALVRDFSPQLGRASAMGFWTLGPVLGSLISTAVVSNTASHLKTWQDQYVIAGLAGVGVFLVALFGLRELAPQLRDQVMVSEHDRALVEARAKGLDIEAALKSPIRQMLRVDILGSAVAISLFLFVYYVAVSFFPLLFQTVFGYSESKANALGTWMWASQAISLVVVGVVSDWLRVRKPFMVAGGVGAVVSTIVLIQLIGDPTTSYHDFAVALSVLSIFLGLAFAPWMAGFTETVEEHNPALTATGLSVWGFTIRIIAGIAVFLGPAIVGTVTTLVEDGPQAQALASQYATELGTAAKIDPATQAALGANPQDQRAQISALSQISGVPAGKVATIATLSATQADALAAGQAIDPATAAALLADPTDVTAASKAVQEIATALHLSPAAAQGRLEALGKIPGNQLALVLKDGPKVQAAVQALTALSKVPAADTALLTKVQKAAADSPGQWQTYLWVAVGGEIVFIPLIFLMAGFWSPRKARRHAADHDALVSAELAKLASPQQAPA